MSRPQTKNRTKDPALRRPVVADRAAQHRVALLERVEHAPQGRLPLDVEAHLAVDARQRPQVLWKSDADHGSVCASTDSTAGRSRTIAVQLSPPSDDP